MTGERDDVAERFTPEGRDESWLPHWLSTTVIWAVLGLLGWLAFEMTAHPELSLVVLCCKFGLHDVANGLWMYQADPLGKRGGIHLLAYVTLALWRITMMSFFLVMVLVITASLLQLQFDGARMVLTVIGVFAAASVCGALTTLAVAVIAWWAGVKVWLSLGISEFRHASVFPPQPEHPNLLPTLFETSLFIGTAGTANAVLLMLVAGAPFPLTLVTLAICCGLFFLVAWRDTIKPAVAAVTPRQCWDDMIPEHEEVEET